MSSRLQPITSSASGSLSSTSTDTASCSANSLSTHSSAILSTESLSFRKVWVDPASLPDHGDITNVAGNAPTYVKQLTSNTLASYGVGNDDCFAQAVGKSIMFVEVNVNKNAERQGRLEAITIADVVVSKSEIVSLSQPLGISLTRRVSVLFLDMLNGAGMLHGGCIAYLIDMSVYSTSIDVYNTNTFRIAVVVHR
jgi:acyl-coenzyme A thioesterase 13